MEINEEREPIYTSSYYTIVKNYQCQECGHITEFNYKMRGVRYSIDEKYIWKDIEDYICEGCGKILTENELTDKKKIR